MATRMVLEILVFALVHNVLPIIYNGLIIKERFNMALNFTQLTKRLQMNQESTA